MADDGVPGLAQKLNHLFATVPGPGRGGFYSNDAAAGVLGERGVAVSGVHLSHLRSGRRDNPSARLLGALAELFEVPVAYFFDTSVEERINADLDALAALKDPDVKRLMILAHGVSPESLVQIEGILNRIRQLEGLDRRSPGQR